MPELFRNPVDYSAIDVENERDLKVALTKAKWMLKEEMAVVRLVRYRELQRRYGVEDDRFEHAGEGEPASTEPAPSPPTNTSNNDGTGPAR